MNRRLSIMVFLSVFFVAGGSVINATADEKMTQDSRQHGNPCAVNPCGQKNPCTAKNPCASAPKKIRKNTYKDTKSLEKTAEKLWSYPRLGTTGASCATCHPDGKGLKTEPFPRHVKMADDILTLDQMINFCVTNPMKGKPLQWNSMEMTALAAYVKSHAMESGEAVNPCGIKNPCAMKNPCGMR